MASDGSRQIGPKQIRPTQIRQTTRAKRTDPRAEVQPILCRILLVEDQPALRATLARALRLNRFEVEAIGTLLAARQCLSQQHFDILLSDVSLENSDDGFVLARWARNLFPSLPIVLMSGLALHDPPKHLAQDPVIRMLPKPFQVTTLVNACRELLARR
eukprot:gene5274-5328_t